MRVLLPLFLAAASLAQQPNGPLIRRYKEGETLTYRMKATNENWRYEIQASGVVKKIPPESISKNSPGPI